MEDKITWNIGPGHARSCLGIYERDREGEEEVNKNLIYYLGTGKSK